MQKYAATVEQCLVRLEELKVQCPLKRDVAHNYDCSESITPLSDLKKSTNPLTWFSSLTVPCWYKNTTL